MHAVHGALTGSVLCMSRTDCVRLSWFVPSLLGWCFGMELNAFCTQIISLAAIDQDNVDACGVVDAIAAVSE